MVTGGETPKVFSEEENEAAPEVVEEVEEVEVVSEPEVVEEEPEVDME